MLTAHLNQKLIRFLPKGARFAIAYSGGGDSTALVHALKNHPQRGPVYIVDHALRGGSDAEADTAKRFASTCGYECKVLKWKHNSPSSAIQEKARKARYRLMGQACRDAGIEYLLTAHSRDDQAETLFMRYERKTDWRGAAGMAEATYAPLWPELAQVNLARPLLDVSRDELRDYNRTHELTWAEDPSNENRDYARIRARDYLRLKPQMANTLLAAAEDLRTAREVEKAYLVSQYSGTLKIHDEGYVSVSEIPVAELLFHILRAVGGMDAIIDRAKIKYMTQMMRDEAFKAATLGGAQIVRSSDGFIICRDPVAVKGRKDGGLKPRAREMAVTTVLQIWDGRFMVSCEEEGHIIVPWAKLDLKPSKALERYVKALPPCVRATTPIIKNKNEAFTPHEIPDLRLDSFIRPRLEAALGTKLP